MRRLSHAAAAAIISVLAFTLCAAAPAAPAHVPPPVPGGLIGTLALGKYTCERPGNAGGPVRLPAQDFDFTVIRGSSYRTDGSRGSYLLAGDVVTMTGGKLKGLKLHQVSDGFLRQIVAGGADGDLRCVLGTAGNN